MSSKDADHSRQSGRSAAPLDETAYRILDVLRDNGRVSIAALADKVGISRASAYTRVESLVHDGVITGFSARVDQAKAGLSIGEPSEKTRSPSSVNVNSVASSFCSHDARPGTGVETSEPSKSTSVS